MENGEAAEEAAPTQALEPEPESTTLTSSADPVQQEHDAEKIDRKLEEEVLQKPASELDLPKDATPAIAPTPTQAVDIAEDAPAAAPVVKEKDEEVADNSERAAETAAIEDEAQPEKPRDPDPTPIASPSKPAKADPVESATSATPVAPPKPAAPKTWANLVAANRVPAPAVPNGAPSTNPTTTPPAPQPKAAPSSTNRSATPPTSANEDASAKGQQNGNSGWQMAGSDNSKKQGRQHSQSVSGSQENVLGYVKNVTDKVDASILKTTLAQYGKLVYFDVSRPKVCSDEIPSINTTNATTELCFCGVCRRGRLQCCCHRQPSFYWRRADLRRRASTPCKRVRRQLCGKRRNAWRPWRQRGPSWKQSGKGWSRWLSSERPWCASGCMIRWWNIPSNRAFQVPTARGLEHVAPISATSRNPLTSINTSSRTPILARASSR